MNVSRRTLLRGMWASGALAVAVGSRVWAEEVRNFSSVQGVGVPKGMVRILYNENPLGSSPLALKAASEVLGAANRYPMMANIDLLKRLHTFHDIPNTFPDNPENLSALFEALAASPVVLGVGSTELLRAAALAYGLEGGEFIEAVPGYTEIGSAADEMLGGKVKRVKIPLTEDYHLDWQAMVKAVTPKTRLVVVTNPNNPTGTALSADAITRLADSLDSNILLVIDEAYIDYATDPAVTSMVNLAKTRPNVLVTRTFSKLHGLAGLRLGYAIGSPEVTSKLRRYTIGLIGTNFPAVVAAIAALDDVDFQTRSREVAQQAKAQLMAKLPAYGYAPIKSEANFVWVNV
ncbi:MAG: aminotransferase class I/II-fold pyridoxal phosphate-dependent enzyme, partial [Coleofasciculus sp. S288]|nr:aminotransferase class I/II-fold pyridoxal phosphate-dependent enzyme [Coleofasciculus sp. S288]